MRPTRTRYSMVVLAIALAMLSYVQRVAISQAAGPISHDLQLSKRQMGLIFGAFGLSYALFEIPMGLLGDRLGVKRVLTQIVLGWSLFTALTGAAWSALSLWIIRFFFGAGEAGCFPNLTRLLSAWLPVRERVRAQSVMWAFTRWSGAATPPLALVCIGWLGWRWAFVAFAALGVVWCVVFLLWFKDDPSQHKRVNREELELLQRSRVLTAHHAGQPKWYSLLRSRSVLLLGLQYFTFSWVWCFYITWLPTYLREGQNQSPARAAALAIFPLLFGGFGSLVSGLAPTRLPRRAIAFTGFIAAAILLLAMTRATTVMTAMLAMGLGSFFSDLTMPISWDACVDIGGPYTATVSATMNMLGNFATFLAPVIGGVILEHTHGNWNILLYTMSAAAFISALCWLGLDPESERRKREKNLSDIAVLTSLDGADRVNS